MEQPFFFVFRYSVIPLFRIPRFSNTGALAHQESCQSNIYTNMYLLILEAIFDNTGLID